MTAAKMDVASNDDSLTEIGKYFAILIFADSYYPRKLEDRENFRVYGNFYFRIHHFKLSLDNVLIKRLKLVCREIIIIKSYYLFIFLVELTTKMAFILKNCTFTGKTVSCK